MGTQNHALQSLVFPTSVLFKFFRPSPMFDNKPGAHLEEWFHRDFKSVKNI